MYMKMALFFILLALVPMGDLMSIRGGGGGGRGGGGYGGRGGGDFNRGGYGNVGARDMSPSMSRSYVPSGQQFHPDQQLQNRSTLGGDNYARTQSQVRDYMQNSPGLSQDRPALNRSFDGQADYGNAIRNNVANAYPNRNDWFGNNFWQNQAGHYPFAENGNWWRAASWYGVSNWLGANAWSSPYYYDDGYAYPYNEPTSSTGDSGTVINIEQQSAPQTQTAPQAPVQAEAAPPEGNGDWLPLGVFAFSKEGESAKTPNVFMQLALNKSGEIGGNLYIKSYNKTYPLAGEVDKKTQKAVWKMTNSENSPFVETGVYNLTQAQTPVKVTFADGSTEKGVLVRIDSGGQ